MRTALFFRTYLTVTVPLYAAMVRDLCASPHLPFELSTVLEDIGQAFLGFADELNTELVRRGVLEHEADADQVTESRIDRMLERILDELRRVRLHDDREAVLLRDAGLQQALRTALLMVHDLPLAPPGRS